MCRGDVKKKNEIWTKQEKAAAAVAVQLASHWIFCLATTYTEFLNTFRPNSLCVFSPFAIYTAEEKNCPSLSLSLFLLLCIRKENSKKIIKTEYFKCGFSTCIHISQNICVVAREKKKSPDSRTIQTNILPNMTTRMITYAIK